MENNNKRLKVYCAGPLFNPTEREEMTAIAKALCEAGYAVYLPHRDGMEFRLVLDVLVQRQFDKPEAAAFLHAAIFALDVYQLAVECDAMVWNLNGRVPDEGAVAEAAMAWTLGKPLIAYKDDVRSLITGRDNPLLVGMVDFKTISSIDDLPIILSQEILHYDGSQILEERFPKHLQKIVQQGKQLWQAISQQEVSQQTLEGSLSQRQHDEMIAELVIELFCTENSVN